MEFINLKRQYQILKKEIDHNIEEVLENADFILGKNVLRFEEKLAEYVGVEHVITCSDGTAALQLIYMAYGIGKGDAVFCPNMTFVASVEPACLLGATPVFCEIDKKTYNIDIHSLERQIQKVLKEGKWKPKAIISVDFLGNPADYVELRRVARTYNLILIEDAAQAIGGSYQENKCGACADIAATSFFPSKPLGCYGDGGAVFTNDAKIAEVIRSLRVHGKGITKYDNVRIGINSRLDTIQAAVLLTKLEKLPIEIEKRQEVAKFYEENLKDVIKCPFVREGNISAYAQYVLFAASESERDKILRQMKQKDIPSILYYPTPMHLLPVFQTLGTYDEDFFNTVAYSKCAFGIPFSPYISREEQNTVIETIREACLHEK